MLVLSSTLLLLGAFAVYAMVLVPAWGSSKYPAGLLPPRVMSRLNWIVAIALVVAFAGNILALLQQTMVFFGADVGRVLGDRLYNVVRIGTRFGDTWNARMMLLMLVTLLFAASVYLRGSQPETVRAFWVANVWVTVLVLGTFSVGSHAAGSLLLPWIAIASDWLHGAAVGFWAGGVAALALVVPVALKPYEGEARRQAMLAALRRFTRIAAAGLGGRDRDRDLQRAQLVHDARRTGVELRRRAGPQADPRGAAGGGRRGASRRRLAGALPALVAPDRAVATA